MSSSSSVRRIKDRGGAGGKITALKPEKPLTENHQKAALGSCKKPTGKENPRAVSRARTPSMCQKMAARPLPMQRIEKAASEVVGPGKDGESRVRWSTSSFPKGKSSNPSDFSRLLSDRLSRISGSDRALKTLGRASISEAQVSDGINAANSFRVLEKCNLKKSYPGANPKGQDEKSLNRSTGSENCKVLGSNSKEMVGNGIRVLEDCKEQVLLVSNLERNGGKCLNGDDVLESNSKGLGKKDVFGALTIVENCKSDRDLYGIGEKALNDVRVLKDCKENAYLYSDLQGSGANVANAARIAEHSRDTIHTDLNSVERDEKSSNRFGASVSIKKDGVSEENKAAQVVNKYPSKLHEKLTYLEGKVKKIASDIKRTKEMLDMNESDASKLILSDIQDKISGIEKAMGHAMVDGEGKLSSSEIVETDNLHTKLPEKSRDRLGGVLKNSVKSLNHEELEARLFPHHKLLRSRTSVGNTAGEDVSVKPSFLLVKSDSVQEEGSMSPIDENPIALEFLASLDKKNPKINSGNRRDQLECAAIQEMDADRNSKPEVEKVSKKVVSGMHDEDISLTADENLEDFDDQENRYTAIVEETEDSTADQLREIGRKSSTGGWFVSEGESVLLAHDDSSCSFYDVTNSEEKSEYKSPLGVPHNLWEDCWLIRAADSDGCSGRFVVAASAGSTLDSGFCSWDFYTKDIRSFRVEDGATSSSRTVLGPLPNRALRRSDTLSTTVALGNQQWWYKPSGPLLVATASCQKVVSIYDIRDGDLIMKWEVQKPVLTMDHSSPLQWRNKGKVVIAETEAITLWDVNSLNPQSLLSISTFGKKVSALHVNNTEAELGGGVRRRVSSSEAEGNDGVFCTQETINVFDFRLPSGVGLKITKHGMNRHSIFTHRDSIFLSSTDARELSRSLVQHFSLRTGKLVSTYALPESNTHFHHSSITQVWGDSNLVMAICGRGLFVFDTFKDEAQLFSIGHGSTGVVREVIGPDDMYCPSFDYLGSRVLLISRDRPAQWKYLS